MKKEYFKIRFLDDVVLLKNSNTQAGGQNLDYISGAVFLGLVARYYDEFEDPFKIFHSSSVRFGEAKPFFNAKEFYKIPYSFYAPKLNKDKVYNIHLVDVLDPSIISMQLQQIRSGYINDELEVYEIPYVYTQKSSKDPETGASKKGGMFGYSAIESGIEWIFSVCFDDDVTQVEREKVISHLLGHHHIGKSKTSQYGRVVIEKYDNFTQNIEQEITGEADYLYLKSSLALFNEQGFASYMLDRYNLKLDQAAIIWEKTQIRTREFTPFNFKRQNNDYSRLVIEQGSVIALKNLTQEEAKRIKQGLGGFLSEGYGEILINPKFLLKKEFSLKKISLKKHEQIQKDLTQNKLCNYLSHQASLEKSQTSNLQIVQDFIQKYQKSFLGVSNSQWGQIRMLTQLCHQEEFLDKVREQITTANAQFQWKSGSKDLLDFISKYGKENTRLLAVLMPKINTRNDNV
ncbi:hypothetical protein CK576_02145 [Campylobacter lari]|nr:hypothetical protein [Campylobacter lari]